MTLSILGAAPANSAPVVGVVAKLTPASSMASVLPLSEWLQVMTEEVQRKEAEALAEQRTVSAGSFGSPAGRST